MAAASFSVWLVLLLTGFVFAGGVHLFLLATLILIPWRRLGNTGDHSTTTGEEPRPPT